MDLYPNAPAARSLARIAAMVDQGGLHAPRPGTRPAPHPAAPAPVGGTGAAPAAPHRPAAFWDRLLHWRKAK